MAEDLLFATLDPTMRAISLPGVEKAILSDTVGFISDLPTQLVAAFRATLEEVTGADLILHVRDIANPASAAQKAQVLEVLADLGVVARSAGEGGEGQIPILEVWNKWDLLDEERAEALQPLVDGDDVIAAISAVTGHGIDRLLGDLGHMLTQQAKTQEFLLPVSDGRRIAWLHAHGDVLQDAEAGEGPEGPLRRLVVRLNPKELGQFESL